MLQSLNININNNEKNDKANAEVKKALIKAQTKLRKQRERQRKIDELAAKAAKKKLWRLNKKKSENKKKKKVKQNNTRKVNQRSHKIQKLTAAELRQEQWRREKLQTEYTKHEEEFSFLAAAINRLWDNTSLLCETLPNEMTDLEQEEMLKDFKKHMNPKIYRCNACGIEGTKRMESIEMFPDNNTTLNYKLTPFQIHDQENQQLIFLYTNATYNVVS